jgi:hypothetical protein
MAGGRSDEEERGGRRGKKETKNLFHVRHPATTWTTNNYGHWCFYSTNLPLLGSFIFVQAGDSKSFPPQAPASVDPPVAPAFAVRRLDEKGISTHLENFVPVGRSHGNPTERVAEVRIEQRVTLYRPATRKSGYGCGPSPDLAMKGAVGAKRISAALRLIRVKPIADEWGSALPIESRAAGKHHSEYQGQNRFHG